MADPLRALPLGGLAVSCVLLVGCQNSTAADGAPGRWRIEVLEEEFDSVSIPDRFSFDFDGDGVVDRLEVTDSSVYVSYANGAEFTHAVREPGEESPRIWDAEVLSFSGDGRFPSIILATCPEPSHSREPANQELIYNDEGRLIHKRQGVYPATNRVGSPYAYPMRALGLDCAWIRSNDSPVCFYASMEDGYLGVSRLIALDPGGYGRLATDPDLEKTFAEKIAKRWEEDRRFLEDPANLSGDVNAQRFALIWYGLEPERMNQVLANRTQLPLASPVDTLRAVLEWLSRSNPRQQAKAYLGLEARIFDSILAEGSQPPSETPAGLLLAVALTRLSTEAVFSRDLTREYHLPWPAQRGHSGPHIDGVSMMDAVFLDYSGDGLLDLVVVGQHSRPFSAIQNEAGYFTDAGYFASADEYVRVWAPGSFGDPDVMTPPCVYFGMERTEEQARRSDYVGCYDSTLGEWYDLAMPRGPYWTEYSPVTFWDSNGDGRLEFAARRQDGKWALLTLVRD